MTASSAVAAAAPVNPSFRSRIQSIDILRGIVMVIMAIDHVRDFFYKAPIGDASSVATDPTNMETTYPALFFTRFITHFCAPVFVFLTGTSAILAGQKKSKSELSAFMIKRGIWLVILELLIITLGWTFDPLYHFLILQVIWAIGVSMIILGLAIHLSWQVVGLIGLIIVFGHNILDDPDVAKQLKGSIFADLAYFGVFAYHQLGEQRGFFIVYSFLPWTGIMMVGYAFGKLYLKEMDASRRRKILYVTGSAMLVLFFLLRYINGYGDPAPWGVQERGATYTFISFLNVTKYPPSLDFVLVTLGPALIMLAFLEKVRNKLTEIMNVFGRVPMFYYILHFFLIHILVVILFFATGHTTDQIVPPGLPFLFRPPDQGFNLWGVYAVWLLVVLILYPLCKKYNRYKTSHNAWWLSYL